MKASTFKIIRWPSNGEHEWLVAVTGKDGSYTPLRELRKDGDGTKPTFDNQRYQAARLLAEQGLDALGNPHAMIGKECGCGTCFCCAAREVYLKAIEVLR